MTTNEMAGPGTIVGSKKRLPPEVSILAVLIGIALVFEILGWIFVGDSFLANRQRLSIIILQVSVIGIIAVGVTQVIITGGVDLSSGSIVGLTAMVAASFAQTSTNARAVYPSLTDISSIWAILAGLGVGLIAGWLNGVIIAKTKIPPFIATLGMMVSARGLAKWYTLGQPVALLNENFTWYGRSFNILGFPLPLPVIIFLLVAVIFHIALTYTRYGKFTYAIGANPQAARVSGIDIGSHLIKVYAVAGVLSGLAGVVHRGARGLRPAGHGRGLRARRHRCGRHRRHLAVGRRRPHHRHGHRNDHPWRDDLRLHLPEGRRLLPGDRQGHHHRGGRHHRPVPAEPAQEGLRHRSALSG